MSIISHWIRIIRSLLSKSYVQADLHYILNSADPKSMLGDRLEWFDSLLEWIRLPVAPDRKDKNESIQSARIRFLLQILERQPDLRKKVSETFQAIVQDSDFTDFFSEAGIQIHYSFTKEMLDRTLSAILPEYRDPASFKQTFARIIRNYEDIDWLKTVDEKSMHKLMDLFLDHQLTEHNVQVRFVKSLIAAAKILGIRMTGLSLENDLKSRLPARNPVTSAFFEIQKKIMLYENEQTMSEAFDKVDDDVNRCRTQIMSIYPLLETSGVSVDLVYKLDTIKILLKRIERVNDILRQFHTRKVSADEIKNIFLNIGAQNLEKTSLGSFLGANVNLIARKLVERTSETGEHYIARNRREYRAMFVSAGGGGIITVFTSALKVVIGKLGLPLFFEGLFTGINYAFSFIVIHLCHFTLATKTPAMTASTLASQLKNLNSEEDEKAFVEEVVHLVRSAFAAVLGNLGLVIPGSVIFDLVYWRTTGQHFLSSEYGLEQIIKHNPFLSLTVIYAIVTGFILWLSSIIGPWIENWFVYRRFFEIFEESPRVQRYFGNFLQIRLSQFFRKNMAAFGTNIALGLLLGFSGIWGTFFGLPLQVRHVTLSAGTLTISVVALENIQAHTLLLIGAVFSIIVIGVFNFGVSFSLSLFVAARARNIRLRKFPHLIVLIWRRFLHGPKDFFWQT